MKQQAPFQSKLIKSKSQFYPIMPDKTSKQDIRLQNQPLKMLLYRNRSLKLLFGETCAVTHSRKGDNQGFTVLSPKNGQPIKYKNAFDGTDRQKEKFRQAEMNEYMIVSHRRKKEQDKIVNSNRDRKEKLGIRQEPKRHKQLNINPSKLDTQNRVDSYNPDNYNWKKSLSKEKGQFQPMRSPQPIDPLRLSHQEYYPSKNTSENDTKQTPVKRNPNKRTAKSKSLSGQQYRENSPLSKPKVIKHVFEAKIKRQPCLSPKSMLFTFGV